MNVLVTGGSGYIGSRLVRVLREQGHRVTVYDIAMSPLDDVRCPERVTDAVAVVDAVFHLAGPSTVYESVLDPEKYWDHISRGTQAVADACRRHGKRLVFTSTQLCDDAWRCPQCRRLGSPYADAKREAELHAAPLRNSLTVRLPNVYDAEGSDPNVSRLYPRLTRMAKESGVVTIKPPEDTPINLVEVEECARILAGYLEAPTGLIAMKGRETTILRVAEEIAAHYGACVQVT